MVAKRSAAHLPAIVVEKLVNSMIMMGCAAFFKAAEDYPNAFPI